MNASLTSQRRAGACAWFVFFQARNDVAGGGEDCGDIVTDSSHFPPFQQSMPKYHIGQQLITPLYQSPISSFAPPASFFSLIWFVSSSSFKHSAGFLPSQTVTVFRTFSSLLCLSPQNVAMTEHCLRRSRFAPLLVQLLPLT
jgi:hypothetical protein